MCRDCKEIPRLVCCFFCVDRGTGDCWGEEEGEGEGWSEKGERKEGAWRREKNEIKANPTKGSEK